MHPKLFVGLVITDPAAGSQCSRHNIWISGIGNEDREGKEGKGGQEEKIGEAARDNRNRK